MDHFLLIAVFLLIVVAIFWCLRSRNVAPSTLTTDLFAPKPLDAIDATPDAPVNFGYKMSWLAIRSSDTRAVLESLPIENVQAANWRTGIVAAYKRHTFVSPPVNDWVFVISQSLPELGCDTDDNELTPLLHGLSAAFGDVQYFGTHRVVDYHAWARFVNGNELRAFAYLGERGEVLADRGEQSAGETELGYDYFDPDSPDAESESYWERDDLCYPDEEHVMEIAGKWSVNPSTIEDLNLPLGVGWVGAFIRATNEAV